MCSLSQDELFSTMATHLIIQTKLGKSVRNEVTKSNFNVALDFHSNLLKTLRLWINDFSQTFMFWNKNFRMRHTLNQIFTTRQASIRKFGYLLEFEATILQRVEIFTIFSFNFWMFSPFCKRRYKPVMSKSNA